MYDNGLKLFCGKWTRSKEAAPSFISHTEASSCAASQIVHPVSGSNDNQWPPWEIILRALKCCSREAEEVALEYIICHAPFLSSFFRWRWQDRIEVNPLSTAAQCLCSCHTIQNTYPVYLLLQAACSFLGGPKCASTCLEPLLNQPQKVKRNTFFSLLIFQLLPHSHVCNNHFSNPYWQKGKPWTPLTRGGTRSDREPSSSYNSPFPSDAFSTMCT